MRASPSDALVLFGVTGDLAHKMIFPALYSMVKRGELKVPVIGVAFQKWSLAQLRKNVKNSLQQSGGIDRGEVGYKDDSEFVLHALRHTTASRLVNAGIDLYT